MCQTTTTGAIFKHRTVNDDNSLNCAGFDVCGSVSLCKMGSKGQRSRSRPDRMWSKTGG